MKLLDTLKSLFKRKYHQLNKKYAKEDIHSGKTLYRSQEETETKPKITKYREFKKRKFKGICKYCSKEIENPLVNRFYCRYCNNWYCEEHSNPAEKHECKGKLEKPGIQPTAESLKYI